MKKRDNSPKLKQHAFTIGEYHLEIIDKLIQEYGFASGSDVVRQAIIKLYLSFEPPYRQPTAAGKIKEKLLDKIEKVDSISDEDYAADKGLTVFDTNDGSKIVMYRGLGHQPKFIPLEGIKEWIVENPAIISETVQDKNKEPDEEYLQRTNVKTAMEKVGIVLLVEEE